MPDRQIINAYDYKRLLFMNVKRIDGDYEIV